jgi:hypothetical protein
VVLETKHEPFTPRVLYFDKAQQREVHLINLLLLQILWHYVAVKVCIGDKHKSVFTGG